jgi:hypothetical protein
MREYEAIDMELVEGPFSHLSGGWHFKALDHLRDLQFIGGRLCVPRTGYLRRRGDGGWLTRCPWR